MNAVVPRLSALLAAAVIAVAAPAPAEESALVRVESPHSVAVTLDRLAAAIEKAGARVFARVDHAAGAAKVDMTIPDNQVLIFGNPKLGTPVMVAGPSAGLDLPLKVVAFDEDGQTVMMYRAPTAMAAEHGVPADHPSIVKMTGALGKLTAAAAKP
ncbi:MAG: DUF302 domain-containing protein [Pseudomonadota bacterium]